MSNSSQELDQSHREFILNNIREVGYTRVIRKLMRVVEYLVNHDT